MTAPHASPDGGACHLLGHGRHGVIRTYGNVAWEAIGRDTCPTPVTIGLFECFACGASRVPGDAFVAVQHAQTCPCLLHDHPLIR
ncbi:hypothetical protein [Nonomuraea basaltis]|uniref:hypothetical protein n=1 Tax=Nonomuraea basaltis TaxID=2495887 RepID=UPI00110C4E17|nr:hypothetical protein [Nonomuraea basaltis]TMR99484.1 hypothetical protein EJK15_06630 [Nonomuraea basaltis]